MVSHEVNNIRQASTAAGIEGLLNNSNSIETLVSVKHQTKKTVPALQYHMKRSTMKAEESILKKGTAEKAWWGGCLVYLSVTASLSVNWKTFETSPWPQSKTIIQWVRHVFVSLVSGERHIYHGVIFRTKNDHSANLQHDEPTWWRKREDKCHKIERSEIAPFGVWPNPNNIEGFTLTIMMNNILNIKRPFSDSARFYDIRMSMPETGAVI